MITYEQFKLIPIENVAEDISSAHINNYHIVLQAYVNQVASVSEVSASLVNSVSSLAAFLSFQLVDSEPSGVTIAPLLSFTNGQVSFLPADLDEEQAAEIWRYLQESLPCGIRAKLADMLWESRKLDKLNHRAANTAIESYLQLVRGKRAPDTVLVAKRACALALELGNGGKDQLRNICVEMRKLIMDTEIKETSGIIYDLYLALLKAQPNEFKDLTDRCRQVAEYHESTKNYELSIPYLELIVAYFHRTKDTIQQKVLTNEIAECYLRKATFLREAGNPFVAESAIKQCLHIFRSILVPKERILELQQLLIAIQKEKLQKLRLIQTPIPNGFRIIDESKQAIADSRDTEDALFRLANISEIIAVSQLREYVDKIVTQSPLYFLATPVQLDRKGRTAARPSDQNAVQRFEMLRQLTLMIQYQGSMIINPAREQFNATHKISAISIARYLPGNPLIPDQRLQLIAKGLRLGLEGDFLTSLHLLIPQLEHGIRSLLESNGVVTSHFVNEEVEEERTLGTYLAQDDTKKILGESLTFTLQCVLTEKSGVNLRNNLSHGLYEPQSFFSPYAIYAWWLILKLSLSQIDRSEKGQEAKVATSEKSDQNT